jgi:hypothetical protein
MIAGIVIALLVVAGLIAGAVLYRRKHPGGKGEANTKSMNPLYPPKTAMTAATAASTAPAVAARPVVKSVLNQPGHIAKTTAPANNRPKSANLTNSLTSFRSLPPNWVEYKDDAGTPYFYNSVTGASQWTKPLR